MMIKKAWIAALILALLAAMAPAVHAYDTSKMPTTEKIKVLETDHFTVLYQAPLAMAATVVAGYCEEAYHVLTRMMEMQPRHNIRVYLIDTFDTHNGWATVVPKNTMAVYLAGSEQGSSIYQPGNYLRRTVYHELMHVLSMDLRAGYNKVMEKIFGQIDPSLIGGDPLSYLLFLSTASPNMLAPRWYLEGLSMYAETEFAAPGRGRSTLGDMIFRTAVKEDNLIPYSEWYITTPRWPYGSTAYWYGMRMIQYLSETSARPNPVGETVQSVSKSFLFNAGGGIRNVSEMHWKLMAREMLHQERTLQTQNLGLLEQLPHTPAKRLTAKSIAVGNVRFAGDKIYLMAATEERRNTLYRYTPETGTLEKIGNAHTPVPFGSLSATATGRHLYYTNLEIHSTENIWYEVRRYDTSTGNDTCLTRQGRYRYVDVSPAGDQLAATSQRAGITYLIEVPVAAAGDARQEKIITTVGLEADLAAPRYSPDGRRIVYVEAEGDRFRLKVYDRDADKNTVLYHSKFQIIAPTWHPDGEQILFGCDANGVYNLYRLPLSGSAAPAPVTHVWGGLFFPSFAGDGRSLAAVSYDGFGPHLVTIAYPPGDLEGKRLPVITPRWKGGKVNDLIAQGRAKRQKLSSAASNAETKNYHSLPAIRPDFWTPWATASTFGAQGGAAAAFSDPANHQQIGLYGGLESKYRSPLAQINYTYRGLKPDLTLYAGLGQAAFPELLESPGRADRLDYAEETRFFGAAATFPLWTRFRRQLSLTLGYEFLQRDVIEELEDDYENVALNLRPTDEDQGSAWGRVDYFNGTVYGRSISLENGFLVSVGAEYSDPSLGGEIDTSRVLADFNQYISMPYLRNHVLKISGTYGAGWGDSFAQGQFGLGGFDLLPAALKPGIPRTLGLRGYNSNFQTGSEVVRAAAAYRFPVWNIFKGLESGFPLYNRDLFLELFYEGGRTYDDEGIGDDIGWLHSAGLEVNYGLTLLRYLSFAPGIGAAYVPQRDDRDPDEYEVVPYLSIKLWANP
jgi:Tol biopolymer transport system component